jgi:Rod binding domain-containing protein
VDAIRAERAEWLMRKLHAGTLSPLDLEYGAVWLQAALADETACRLYTDYLEQLSQSPDNRRMLGLAMRVLAQANPAAYAQVLRDAIRNGNASLAGAGMAAADLAQLPAPEFLELARGAAALGDPYAAYNAMRGIQRRADGLPREGTRALLQEIYARPGDAGVQSQAFETLARQGLVDPGKDWKMFAEQAANGRTAEQRYLGMVHLAMANAGLIGQQTDAVSRIRCACDVMPTIGGVLVDQLNDPDPLVRWAAARHYEAYARDLDETARSVQVAGSLEAAVAGH